MNEEQRTPITPLAGLTDEELLQRAYMARDGATDLELELAQRLEWLIDEYNRKPTSRYLGGDDA